MGQPRFKDRLLEICSHDLRSPLNVILMQAERLLNQDGLAEDNGKALQAIRRQGGRAVELIESILEQGRQRTGPQELTRARLDIAALLRSIATDLSCLAEPAGVTIRVLGEVSLEAYADRSALTQVIENLLRNGGGAVFVFTLPAIGIPDAPQVE